ncbi:XTP/dITP diphosphatase [bacterium]|nr:MAG: XTP/dITP diphosphatase [bacterium]
MHSIILATGNKKKIEEIKEILTDMSIELRTTLEFPNLKDVVEDKETFVENALKKAREVYAATGMNALADDSGLEVDALDGRPGVYSARYAGDGHPYAENNKKVLGELAGISDGKRTARFHCVLAYVGTDTEGKYFEKLFDGVCEGLISHSPIGDFGFGYDPIFFVPEYGKTMAQLDPEIKNRISHRGRALEKFKEYLRAEQQAEGEK